jgi:hypothetical protein
MANENGLILRDASTAALLGVIANGGEKVSFGSDFGGEFGGDFDASYGAEDFGAEDFGVEEYFGAEITKAPPVVQAMARKAVAMQKKAQQTVRAASATLGRDRILNPNMHSTSKIEHYLFALQSTTALPVWGTASQVTFSDNPKVEIRPQRLLTNVETPGLLIITNVTVTNLETNIGSGSEDASWFGPKSVGTRLDFPTIEPSMRLAVVGNWGAYVAPSYIPTVQYPLCIGVIGPAKMAGK